MFLVGFWPARPARGAARGAGGRCVPAGWRRPRPLLAGWLFTQSKGGGIALAALGDRRVRRLAGPAAAARAGRARGRARRRRVPPPRGAVRPGLDLRRRCARDAGWAVLWLTAAAAVAGLLYALADRRLELPAAGAGWCRGSALVVAVLAVVAVPVGGSSSPSIIPAAGSATSGAPSSTVRRTETASTHFLSLGSNRYDFWRVALHEFEDHPLAGIGAAASARRTSSHAPQRRDAGAGALVRARRAERARHRRLRSCSPAALGCRWSCSPAAARGAATSPRRPRSAAARTSWSTRPSTGPGRSRPSACPCFLLLGTGRVRRTSRADRRRRARAGVAIAAVAAAVLAFAPPWLSARLSSHALEGSSSPASDLRWARRLDPLSTEPYLVAGRARADAGGGRDPAARGGPPRSRARWASRYELALGYLPGAPPDRRAPRAAAAHAARARRASRSSRRSSALSGTGG